MKELRDALLELLNTQKNLAENLASAFQNTVGLFAHDEKAYLTPYQTAFEVIGLDLENDYFKHAELAKADAIPENITPLQAAQLIIKIFNKESFFIINNSALLAFSQMTQVSNILAAKQTSNTSSSENNFLQQLQSLLSSFLTSEDDQPINLTVLATQLGSVNCLARYQLIAERLEKAKLAIETATPLAVGLKELTQVIAFMKRFSKVTMDYLDSLIAFQRNIVAAQPSGNSTRLIDQLLSDVNAKEAEQTTCERKLEQINKKLQNPLAALFDNAFAWTSNATRLEKRIAELKTELTPLKKKLNDAQRSILTSLQEKRAALNGLQAEVQKLATTLLANVRTASPKAKSSSYAWKRAVLEDKPELLAKLFELGLNPNVVLAYIFPQDDTGTIKSNSSVSKAVTQCVMEACERFNNTHVLPERTLDAEATKSPTPAIISISPPEQQPNKTLSTPADAPKKYPTQTLRLYAQKKPVSGAKGLKNLFASAPPPAQPKQPSSASGKFPAPGH